MPETAQQTAQQPVYEAFIAMRVKRPDGIYVDLSPGEPIPAGVVESWPDPQALFKRKHFGRIDGMPLDPHLRGKYIPPRALTEDDLDRHLEAAPPRPGHAHEPIGPVDGKQSAARNFSDQELDAPPPETKPASPERLAELQNKTRRELINFAAQTGVHVAGNESKDALISALLRVGAEEVAKSA
jgi:hypothetical protein